MPKPDLSALREAVAKRSLIESIAGDPPKPAAYRAPSRDGKRNIAVHLPPAYRTTLAILKAQQDRSAEKLVAEALNDLFRKYGLPALD